MPNLWVNGGAPPVKTSESAAYGAALTKSPGDRTAEEQRVIASVEARIEAIAGGFQDSGGTGGRQAAIALEAAGFMAELEAARVASINQWAHDAAKGSRKAQAEMHGADSKFLLEIVKLLYELRERLNDSSH